MAKAVGGMKIDQPGAGTAAHSGEEHWLLLEKVQVAFPAPHSRPQLPIALIPGDLMPSTGLPRHCTHVAQGILRGHLHHKT